MAEQVIRSTEYLQTVIESAGSFQSLFSSFRQLAKVLTGLRSHEKHHASYSSLDKLQVDN